MKKILFSLILCVSFLLPAIVMGQSSRVKSAEDFVRDHLKLFEQKDIDIEIILNKYAEDGKLLGFGDSIYNLPMTMKRMLESEMPDSIYQKFDIIWIHTRLIEPDAALVTTKFSDISNRSGKELKSDVISNFLLQQIDNTWKINMWTLDMNYPIVNNNNVDDKYHVGNYPVYWKYSSLLGSSYGFECNVVDYFKKNGMPPAELGKALGRQYADRWDESADYNTFIKNLIGFTTFNTLYMEIVEQTDSTLNMKILSPTIDKKWDLSRSDMNEFAQSMWIEIANKIGADFKLADDGTYWNFIVNKRK